MYSQAKGTNGNGGPGKRNERFEQMTKQQELIERKKREIQAKLEAEKVKKEQVAKPCKAGDLLASQVVGGSVPSTSSTSSNKDSESEDVKPSAAANLKFANDGSFMEQFRRMQEEQKKKKEETKEIKKEPFDEENEYGTKQTKPLIKYLNPPSKSTYSEEPSNSNQSIKLESYANTSSPSMEYDNRTYGQNRSSDHDRYGDYNRPSFRGCFQNAPPPPPPPPPPPVSGRAVPGGFPSQVVRRLAQQVAEQGDHLEERARRESSKDPLFWFLNRPDSNEYRRYREVVTEYKQQLRQVSAVPKLEYGSPQPLALAPSLMKRRTSYSSSDEGSDDEKRASRNRKRKSRWGDDGSGGAIQPFINQHASERGSLPAPVPPPPPLSFNTSQSMAPMFSASLSKVSPSPVPPPIAGTSAAFGDVKPPTVFGNFPLMLNMNPSSAKFGGDQQTSLTKVTRTNPQLLAYAQQAYGTTQLDEDQWKQCEEAYKMNMVFQDIARKKARDQELEMAGKFKHEYDSDEETDGGTWEHRQRMKEMDKTREWADELTSKSKGKHHIGDFLPPEELSKFMDKYKAVKEGKQLDDSDYQDFKITESNLGFKMLQKMGWTEGQGLGSSGQGIIAPIQKGNAGTDKQGLGQKVPDDLTGDDDEFSAYRKRMMLAYRFRPNPLNNPRRAYY